MTNKKTLLLTRPALQSEKCATNIEEMFPERFRFLISPLLDISGVGTLPDLKPFQAIIFTSANGVRQFIEKGGRTKIPCVCVGDRTTATAREHGLDGYSAKGSADDLVRLAGQVLNPTAGPLLYIRGKQAAGDIASRLNSLGFSLEELTLYRQNPRHLTLKVEREFATGKVDVLPIYSPMTASLLADTIKKNPDWPLENISVICISRNVEKQLVDLKFGKVRLAETPSQDAMERLLGEYLRGRL